MRKRGVRRRIPVAARALLLLLVVVGMFGMHSLAAGGTAGAASTSPWGTAGTVLASTHHASLGAAASGSALHSMGHDCIAVLTDAPGVALGMLMPVAAAPGDLPDRTPASTLRAVGAALDRASPRPAPSLDELSILRV